MENIIYSSAQIKDYDMTTSKFFGIPEVVLIERAAISVYEGLTELLESEYKDASLADPILVMCGIGNNGADGIAIARLLYLRGYNPHVVIMGDQERTSDSNKQQRDIFSKYLEKNNENVYGENGRIKIVNEENAFECVSGLLENNNYFAIVDAMWGVGISRKISLNYNRVMKLLNNYETKRIAVDVPSGIGVGANAICADDPFKADITYTFAFKKASQLLYPTRKFCGDIRLADVGIYQYGSRKDIEYPVIEHPQSLADFKWPKRPADAHKGTFKKLLIIAGSRDVFGAALLSTMAAFATGVGMIKVITHENNKVYFAERCPESMVETYTDETTPQECEAIFESANKWADGILIGPGIGLGAIAQKFVSLVLFNSDKPTVIDADGLTILAPYINCFYHKDGDKAASTLNDDIYQDKSLNTAEQIAKAESREYVFDKKRKVVLTPHVKEYQRIGFNDFSKEKCGIFDILHRFCSRHNCTVIFKDAVSIVASSANESFESHLARIIDSGNSGMATAGSGDVLAGITAVLLLQMGEDSDAASAAAYVHGLAGTYAMQEKGSRGMMPQDIINNLKNVWDEVDKLT